MEVGTGVGYKQIKKVPVLCTCANMLYRRVKKEGNIEYVKCHVIGCDGSAKLIGEHFFIGVCLHLYNARRAICLLHAPIAYCVKIKQASEVVEIIDVAVFLIQYS